MFKSLNLSRIRLLFVQLIYVFFSIQFLIYATCDSLYLRLKARFHNQLGDYKEYSITTSTTNNNKLFQLKNQLEETQRQIVTWGSFMAKLGMYARETSIVGITIYHVCNSCAIFYLIVGGVIGRKWRDKQLRTSNLILYLIEPELESKRIEQRICDLLKRVTESNSNYTNLRFNDNFELEQQSEMETNSQQLNDSSSFDYLFKCFIRKTQNRPFKIYSIDHDQQERIIKQDLDKQQNHLKNLAKNKMLMWPPHRNEHWRLQLKQFYIRIYQAFVYILFAQAVITQFIVPYMEINAIGDLYDKLSLEANQASSSFSNNVFSIYLQYSEKLKANPLSMVEKVTFSLQFISVYILLEIFMEPLFVLIILYKDHKQYLDYIMDEFDELDNCQEAFQQFKTNRKKEQQPNSFPVLVNDGGDRLIGTTMATASSFKESSDTGGGGGFVSFIHSQDSENINKRLRLGKQAPTSIDRKLIMQEELEQEMRYHCDKQAIKIYMAFKLFQAECKSSLNIARKIVDQRVVFLLGAVLPILLLVDNISLDDLPQFIGYAGFILLGTDLAFCVCALIHSSSMKVCTRAWSLLANSTSSDPPPPVCLLSEHLMPCASKSRLLMNSKSSIMNFRHPFKFQASAAAAAGDLESSGDFERQEDGLGGDYYDEYDEYDDEDDGGDAGIGTGRVNGEREEEEDASACCLTPHTLILWQRLLESHELLASHFLVKLFGFIPLDFNGVLKINFWAVSIVLLSFIYRY